MKNTSNVSNKVSKASRARKDWETIADVLTDEHKKIIKRGDMLGFKQADGSQHHYKVMRVNRAKDIFMVKRMKMYTPEEYGQLSEEELERLKKFGG